MAISVVHKEGDWALCLHDAGYYMVRHLLCGRYLRGSAINYLRDSAVSGCLCTSKLGSHKTAPIEENILKMFLFVNNK